MALQKSETDPTGGDASQAYHKITQMWIDLESQTASFTVTTWRNAAAKAANKAPLFSRQFSVQKDARNDEFGNSFPAFASLLQSQRGQAAFNALHGMLYDLAKTLSQFSGATEV